MISDIFAKINDSLFKNCNRLLCSVKDIVKRSVEYYACKSNFAQTKVNSLKFSTDVTNV